MSRCFIASSALSLAANFCDVHQVHAAILFSQPVDDSATRGATSIAIEPTTADNFVASGSWLVDSASFSGLWTTTSGAVSPNDTSRPFRIDFYADENGSPATVAFQQFHLTGALSNYATPARDFSSFDVAVSFPIPVALTAGSRYWFGVVDEGLKIDVNNGFYWWSSAAGDLLIAQRGLLTRGACSRKAMTKVSRCSDRCSPSPPPPHCYCSGCWGAVGGVADCDFGKDG